MGAQSSETADMGDPRVRSRFAYTNARGSSKAARRPECEHRLGDLLEPGDIRAFHVIHMKFDPPFPPSSGRPVSEFLKVCSKARNLSTLS